MKAPDPHIELIDLSLDRSGRSVLRNVDARFPKGVVTAMVGPSGPGKTSLLRCINRLEEPFEGRVLLDGIDIREVVRSRGCSSPVPARPRPPRCN